jgi:hypothetical protein
MKQEIKMVTPTKCGEYKRNEWMGFHKYFLGLDDYGTSSFTIASYLTQPMAAPFKLNITTKDCCPKFYTPKMQKNMIIL